MNDKLVVYVAILAAQICLWVRNHINRHADTTPHWTNVVLFSA